MVDAPDLGWLMPFLAFELTWVNLIMPLKKNDEVTFGKRPLWYVPVLPPLYRCTIAINSMVFAVSEVSNSLSPLLDM